MIRPNFPSPGGRQMTKTKSDNGQLKLDLPPDENEGGRIASVIAPVINFVDAKTLTIRREAIERVHNLGIFHFSKDSGRHK